MIYLYNDNGEKRIVDTIPKVEIDATGDFELNVYESFKVSKKCKMTVGHGFVGDIGKNVLFDNFWADFNVESLRFSVGNGTHIIGAEIFASGMPGLSISFGKNCLFSRKIVFRTTDGHTIFDMNNPSVVLNKPQRGITVGDHVWIGEGVSVAKEVNIPSDCVVGGYSVVIAKDFSQNSIIAGEPAQTIKTGINWDKSRVDKYMYRG